MPASYNSDAHKYFIVVKGPKVEATKGVDPAKGFTIERFGGDYWNEILKGVVAKLKGIKEVKYRLKLGEMTLEVTYSGTAFGEFEKLIAGITRWQENVTRELAEKRKK